MVVLLSECLGIARVPDNETPPRVAIERDLLATSEHIVKDSLQVWQDAKGHWLFTARIRFHWTPGGESRLPQPEEPVAFHYRNGALGSAPPVVVSERRDFPRDLYHENPVGDNSPVSFCLARGDLHLFYATRGIRFIADRIAQWLRDASAGCLMAEGWDPFPRTPIHYIMFDAEQLQNRAHQGARSGQGQLAGYSLLRVADDNQPRGFYFDFLDMPAGKLLELKPKTDAESPALRLVPTLVVWDRNGREDSRWPSSNILNVRDLGNMLIAYGARDRVTDYLESGKQGTLHCFSDGLVLILAIRRPEPIIQDIPCLAGNDARKYELVPLWLTWSPDTEIALESAQVGQLGHLTAVSPQLFRFMSRTEDSPLTAVLIGAGALGSSLAELLHRSGIEIRDIIEKDQFLPHNAARHVLTLGSAFQNKGVALAKRLDDLTRKEAQPVQSHAVDVQKDNYTILDQVTSGKDLVIDATASLEIVPGLSFWQERQRHRIIRAELLDGGQLGLLSVSGANGNPRLDDLQAYLHVLALDEVALEEWHARIHDPDQYSVVNLGLGCSSLTTRTPFWKVQAHASAFMHLLTAPLHIQESKSGIALNILNEEGCPAGTRWHEVPPFKAYECINAKDWKVRICQHVIDQVHGWSAESAPNETGGYLYGCWLPDTQTIHIVWASVQPPGTEGMPLSLSLGAAGNAPEEKSLLHKTSATLIPMGSWHSHPASSPLASGTDMETLDQLRRDTEKYSRPALMFIASTTGEAVYAALPNNWSAE